MRTRVLCAIAGCGMVADEYAQTLARSRTVELTACTDIDLERAHAFAQRHNIPAVGDFERLDGELVVVLTPPEHHVAVASAAIHAGKSVYVEKPLAPTAGEAEVLLSLADRHGVVVGAAPDTFLSPPVLTAAKALAAGLIGEPIAATAAHLSPGPERWHPRPQPIYNLGPLLDMAPYYLTVLVHLLGPIAAVRGASCGIRTLRIDRCGEVFTATAPTHIEALLETTTGVPITLTTSFDIQGTTRPHLEIYGTDGTLVLPDPNFHHGTVRLRRRGEADWQALTEEPSQFDVIGRGIGVLDLANAMLTRQPPQASGDLALHVLHIAEAVRQASDAKTGPAVPAIPRLGDSR